MIVGLLVRIERLLLGVHRRVLARHPWDDAVGEEFRGVTADEIAREQALADEHRVVERPVVIGDIDLAEPPLHARQQDRLPTHVHATCIAGDPVRRVRGDRDELGGRRRRRPRFRAAAKDGDHEDGYDSAKTGHSASNIYV